MAALDVSIDERRVRVAELQVARLGSAFLRAIEDCAPLLGSEAVGALRSAVGRRPREAAGR